MKRMILFPGVGYTTEKPLLYYARKLGMRYGFECSALSYSGFPKDIKSAMEKREDGYSLALRQTEEQLSGIDLTKDETVIFVSKSIGTVAAARFADRYDIPAKQVFLTPLKETFEKAKEESGFVFHGTKDPLADTDEIKSLAEKLRLPLHLVKDGNHSLETGDVQTDLKILQVVMHEIEKLLFSYNTGGTAE